MTARIGWGGEGVQRKTVGKETSLKDREGCVVHAPIVLVERMRSDIRCLDPRVLTRKVEDVELDGLFFAEKKGLDDVHLDEWLRQAFFPEGDQIRGVGVPYDRRSRRNAVPKESFLQS